MVLKKKKQSIRVCRKDSTTAPVMISGKFRALEAWNFFPLDVILKTIEPNPNM